MPHLSLVCKISKFKILATSALNWSFYKCILVGGGSKERQSISLLYLRHNHFSCRILFCLVPHPIPQCIAKNSNAITSINRHSLDSKMLALSKHFKFFRWQLCQDRKKNSGSDCVELLII